jgi:iron complex transport system substrate-binding protein
MINSIPILNRTRMKVLKLSFIMAILIASGCRNINKRISDKMPVTAGEYSKAERFTLDRRNGYTVLKIINPWQGALNINMEYYLVKRGTELPAGLDSSAVLFVPVQKIICMSTTHVAMISALGEENTIKGMSGTGFIYDGNLVSKVNKGLIEDVGYEANLNKELILGIAPDLIMIYGIGSESAGYVGKLKELGVRVIFNADYLETDPLRKAEWIKLFGALYCKEDMADSIYKSEVEAYLNLKSFINEQASVRPKVLLGLPYKDTWYISPGNSFISKLISDAGGDYLWQNTESPVSMPYGIENVYLRAITADFWLNIGSINTKGEISMVDKRLEQLPCFEKGNLFNNNYRVTLSGGNDYWESGSLYPHLILKDIATILHPDLFNNDELFYYRKIY